MGHKVNASGPHRAESEADFHAAAARIFAAVADDPFDEWCTRPPESFHLTEA